MLRLLGMQQGRRAYVGPRAAQIDLTNRCNNQCVYCWARSPLLKENVATAEWQNHELSYPLVRALINDLARLGVESIHLSGGGEPFLHPQIWEIIAHIKGKGLRCEITTNATLLDEKAAERLVDLGVDHLTVSLWAADSGMYARLHSGANEETFLKIARMIQHLSRYKKTRKKAALFLRLTYVISNLNYRDIPKMALFTKEAGADASLFQVMDAVAGYTDSLLLNDSQRQEIAAMMGSQKDLVGCDTGEFLRRVARPAGSGSYYDQEEYRRVPCYAGWLFSRVTAEGNVNFCLKTDEYPIGNLYQKSFREIWFSKGYADFRQSAFRHSAVPGRPRRCHTTCDNRHDNLSALERFQHLGNFSRWFLRWSVRL